MNNHFYILELMTLKTLKTKQNISLTIDKEFLQYCKLNNIEDVEKLAKETFKRGFDLLKYGSIPEGELTPQDKGKVVKKGNIKTLKELVEKQELRSPGVYVSEPPPPPTKPSDEGVKKENLYDE